MLKFTAALLCCLALPALPQPVKAVPAGCPVQDESFHPGCLATLEMVRPLLDNPEHPPLVIDIRKESEYQDLLFGAVHMAPFSVKARGYLKDRTILLYD